MSLLDMTNGVYLNMDIRRNQEFRNIPIWCRVVKNPTDVYSFREEHSWAYIIRQQGITDQQDGSYLWGKHCQGRTSV